MDIRNFLFSNRSFTPVPIALVIIYLSDSSILYFIYGMPLILVGELIRINAVSHAGGITRTMNVGAPSLCTSGPYSRTRNPLYLGNMIIYLGIVLVAGGEYVFILEGIVFLYFTFQYMMIISLEEETLKKLFGDEYISYMENVPRLFPKITPWTGGLNVHKPSDLYKTIKTEKRTLQNIILILSILVIKSQL
jgi:protein-S-isoprenylcysteine O-methyltransferase Ste14